MIKFDTHIICKEFATFSFIHFKKDLKVHIDNNASSKRLKSQNHTHRQKNLLMAVLFNAFQKTKLISFLVLIAGLMSGCVSNLNMLPELTTENIQPSQGIVVARVINASPYNLPFNQLTLSPENVNTSKEVKFDRLTAKENTGLTGSTVFAAPITPGKYALTNIRSFYSNGNYWYDRFISADVKFGTFTVKAGEITDLGTLIYYQRSVEDRYFETLIRLTETEHSEVLNKYYPFHSYNPLTVNTWDNDDRDQERESLFVSAAQNPTTYNTRYVAPDGSIYFLAKLGVIIKRSPKGDWSMDAVDSNFDLTSIAENNNGDLVVGGVEGKLFIKYQGQDWKDISLTHKDHIKSLVFSSSEQLDMIIENPSYVSIQRSRINALTITQNKASTNNALNWKEVNRYDTINGWKYKAWIDEVKTTVSKKSPLSRKMNGFSLLTLADKDFISINTIYSHASPVFAVSKSTTYHYDPKSWEVHRKEEKLPMTLVIDAGAIKLGIKKPGFWSLDGKTSYFTYNAETKIWEKISTHLYKCPNQEEFTLEKNCKVKDVTQPAKRKSFILKALPWYKTPLEAFAIVGFEKLNIWTAERTTTIKIVKTNDGGKTWKATAKELPKPFCSDVVTEVSDRWLISCNGVSGDFYESFDDGNTWNHVRQHENF